MCGIAGVYRAAGLTPDDRAAVTRVAALQSHRGPDSHGDAVFDAVAFGHRRLAIIDLSPTGHQPMAGAGERYWITFNGEIYNYRALRAELLALGHQFRGGSDTEVVLAGYAEWGAELLPRLEGMFAFGLWDRETRRLLLARDRMGVNQLYYTIAPGGAWLAFASEVQALARGANLSRELDRAALHHYIALSYAPQPNTIYREIRALPPGHLLEVNPGGHALRAYWQLPPPRASTAIAYPDAVRELRRLLEVVVADHQVADVPVAAFLSGGIDSTAIVALMARQSSRQIETFTLTSHHARMDEGDLARMVAAKIGTRHTEHLVTPAELRDSLTPSILRMSQPYGDFFETYFVSSLAARRVKVVLSGAGGDELFGGYHRLRAQLAMLHPAALALAPLTSRMAPLLDRHPLGTALRRALDLARPAGYGARIAAMTSYRGGEQRGIFAPGWGAAVDEPSTEELLACLYAADEVPGDPVGSLMMLDLRTYLRMFLLPLTDSAAMAHGLEVRVPLVDHRLVEFAAQLPASYKYRRGVSKRILRDAVRDLLPEEVLNAPKRGFGIPRHDFIRGELRPLVEQVLGVESVTRRGIFLPEAVTRVVRDFYAAPPARMLWAEFQRVWSLFILELWLRAHVDAAATDWSGAPLTELLTATERDRLARAG